MEDEQEVVNTPEETTTPVETVESAETVEQTQQETPVQGKAPIDSVDEFGVPWKNRFMEMQRKNSDLAEKLPEMIENTLAKHGQQQQPQYTEAQLKAFVRANPEYADWADQQLETLHEKKTQKAITEAIEKVTVNQQNEIKKQQSYQYVAQSFPECFIDTPYGKQWNPQNTMTQLIGQVMQDPRIKDQPDALAIAAEIAHSRMVRMNQNPQTQKLESLKRENTKLKRATLVEGGGVSQVPPAKDAMREAQERLAKTGSRKDAEAFLGAYLRKTGRLS